MTSIENFDRVQLDNFLKAISRDLNQDKLKLIEHIIDVDKRQSFTKKMFILQWYFYKGDDDFPNDASMYRNALFETEKNSLIKRFNIAITKIGGTVKLLDPGDRTGYQAARSEMNKMIGEEILFRKEWKNKILTEIGEICAKFLYFKLLEEKIGVKGIWNLLNLELNEKSLQIIKHDLSIKDLFNWFVVEDNKGDYQFTNKFLEIIEFLKDHPELYPKEFKIVTNTLLSRLKNSLINNLDKLDVRLTKSGNKIYYYKDIIEDIDWIYKIDCKYDRRGLSLLEWANNFENYCIENLYEHFDRSDDKLKQFQQNLLVLQAPAGYGKTILLYQLGLDIFNKIYNESDFRIIPMFFSIKNFEIKNNILYYNKSEVVDLEEFNRYISTKNSLKFINNVLLRGILSEYNYNNYTINFFNSVLNKYPILLIFDGWDEALENLKQIIKNLLITILKNQLKTELKDVRSSKSDWIKIIISTRYVENSIISIYKHYLGESLEKKNYFLNLKLPEKDTAFNYLQIVSDKFNSEKDFEIVAERFHGYLTPLDLYILGIFPKMEIPKYKSQMYERWVYYQVLSEHLDSGDYKSIRNDEDIRSYLEKIKIPRNSDKNRFFLMQYVDGYLYGNDQVNYSLFEVLPQIAYSSVKSEHIKSIRYFDATINNPILKRFIRPYYEGLQNYARLLDPHFLGYFLAKYIYNRFLKDSPVEPIPNWEIEDFLQEFFLRDINNPKIKEIGIRNEKDFPNYLYLQSNVILPALNIPYNYGNVSFPWNWESLEYGNYIMKGFQFEFQKAIKNNDLEKKWSLLDLFREYKVNRPTKVWGSFLDEISKEYEMGEPQENHNPPEYFTLITKLLDLEDFDVKSREEIRYLELADDYLMEFFHNNLDHSANRFYYKKEDLPKLIIQIFESDNIYLIPWYAKVYDGFKRSKEYQISLNEELIIKKYESTQDKFIKNSLLKILIDDNPNRALEESDRFLKSNDKDHLDQLIRVLIEKIKEIEKIPKDLFTKWIKYYKNSAIALKQKYEMVKIFFEIELDDRQISILSSIYRNEKFDLSKKLEDEKYLNPEENPKEYGFMFNCLLFLNYRNQNKALNDMDYGYLGDYNLLFDYALKTRKYFYFTLIKESESFSDEEIEHHLSRCGFELLFSFSENIFRNHPYMDRSYYKKLVEFLSDINNYLLEFQKTWWDKNKPKNYYDIERYLRKVFEFFKEHKDTWGTVTRLGGSYILHEDKDHPELIQLNAIFDVIENDFPDIMENVAKHFFKLVSDYFLSEEIQIDDYDNDEIIPEENLIHLPKFVIHAFEEFQDISPEIRLEWIDELISKKVDFKDFKILFRDIKDYKYLYDKIWKKYGDYWIGGRWWSSRRRPEYVEYLDINGKDNKDEVKNIIHLLPFEFVNEKLKDKLDWEELQSNYDKEVYERYIEELKETEIVKEKSKDFLSALQKYSIKLSELALFLEDPSKPLLVLRDLWEKYYIYPLVPQEVHPSYKIFWNLTIDLPKKLYPFIKNPIAKIYLILCQFGRFYYGTRAEVYNQLLKELLTFKKSEIEEALVLIIKTDWSFKHKLVLLLYSNFSPIIIPIIKEFLAECQEELDWEIKSKIRSIKREKGIYKGEPLNLPKKEFRFEDIFENESLFELNILRNYSLLLSLLYYEIPNEDYLNDLLSDYSNERYDHIIKDLKNLKISKYARMTYLLDEKKLIELQEFKELKQFYVEKINSVREKQSENDYSFYSYRDSKIFHILNYFRKSKEIIDEMPDYKDQSTPRDDYYNFSSIKDQEVKNIINGIKNETINPDEIIEFIKAKGLYSETENILRFIIPTFHIDSWDDYYDEKAPKISRKHQKQIFWFLVYLLYDKTEYKRLVKREVDDYDYYYLSNNFNYFIGNLEEYIKRLIFDGIQYNNLLEWYNNCPKNIPSEWIKETLDPIIIKEIFFPNQIEFIPTHLRDKARRHAWKYLIISDLVNEINTYFEGYRNTFPEIKDDEF